MVKQPKQSVKITEQERKQITKTVFCALLVDILSFTLILPLLPRLLDYYRTNESNDPNSLLHTCLTYLHAFKAMIGAHDDDPRLDVVLFGGTIGSLFSLLQFAVSPVIGRLSDTFGRKRVLMLCMVGNLASCLVWVVAKQFSMFVLSRVIGGLFEGNVQLSVSMISDITTQSTRSRGLALVGIAFAMGFTIGPAMGAYLASHDMTGFSHTLDKVGMNPYSASALFSASLILVEIIYLHFALPETLNLQSTTTTTNQEKPSPTKSTLDPRSRQAISILSNMHFIYLFLFSGLEFTLTFFTYDHFAFTNKNQGLLLGYIGLVTALVQGGYTRRRAHALGEQVVVVQGIATCALAFAMLARPAMFTLWIAATLLAFTSATVVTCLTTLTSLHLHGQSGGQAMGAFRSFGQLGRALGPLIACAAYWVFGSSTTYSVGSLGLLITMTWFICKCPSIKIVNTTKVE